MPKDDIKVQSFFDKMFLSNNNPQQTEQEQTSEYFKALIQEFYDTKNMKLKADLTKDQVFLMTRVSLFAKVFNSKVMKDIEDYLLEYSVSKDRKGRIEYNEIFKFANDLKTNEFGYDNALMGLIGRRGV